MTLDVLKDQRKVRGLQTFAKLHGLNYGNMNVLKHNLGKGGARGGIPYQRILVSHESGYYLGVDRCSHKGVPKPKNLRSLKALSLHLLHGLNVPCVHIGAQGVPVDTQ